MPDANYSTIAATVQSKGIAARYSDDTLPQGTYLNLENAEELIENALSGRLGSTLITATGTVPNGLGSYIHTIHRLPGFGATWRYAGAFGGLFRRAGDTPGPYSIISALFSGQPWSAAVYRPNLSSYPYIFFADLFQMVKDNGTLGAPQKWGIFQPNTPVRAKLQAPQYLLGTNFAGATFANTTSSGTGSRVATTTTSNIAAPGVQTVTLASVLNILQYELLTVGAEVVLVMQVTANGIMANFASAHTIGTAVVDNYVTAGVAANTTATITVSGLTLSLMLFGNGVVTQGGDYIAAGLFVDNPNNLQELRVMFDVTDGTFTQSYFYKVAAPSEIQTSVDGTVDPTEAVSDQVFADTLQLYGEGALGAEQLASGSNNWSSFLSQLSQFAGVGNADFNDPNYNWANIKAIRIQIVTNNNGGVNIGVNNLLAVGGAGPDSFGGVSYDWVYTYYNAVTGMQSNPCMFMADQTVGVNPPYNTTRLLPRRAPVLLTLVPSTDPQVTDIIVYRRGGTLSANFLQVKRIPAASTSYLDTAADADIEAADILSLVQDVPVTSTLPVPVNTTLTANYSPAFGGALVTMAVGSAVNISVAQQVTIGTDIDPNQEVVIVQSVNLGGNTFTAFIQNPHLSGDPVEAEAVYGQPVQLCEQAYNMMWFAGDPNNPHYLYYSTSFNPEAVGAGNSIEVGTPAYPITAIIEFNGTLYVATTKTWWAISPGTQGGTPTPYPTEATFGVVAPFAWVKVEREIWFRSLDGIRSFNGSAATYRSQDIEFIFQGSTQTPVPTPIVLADPSPINMAKTRMVYWNNIVFVGYWGVDGVLHRLAYHTIYQRWRNDDIAPLSMYVEPDTNALLYGTAQGFIFQDRIGFSDDTITNPIAPLAIPVTIQTAYNDAGQPKVQKNYNEITIDANTQGQELQVNLLLDDGETIIPIGTFATANRQKANLVLNDGDGYQAYRASLQIVGSLTQKIVIYQVDIKAVALADTRQSFDTYVLKFGTDESKIMKQVYVEYNCTETVNVDVYYDGVLIHTFTLPVSARISTRFRLPAIKFRLFRMVMTSGADFQLWTDSKFEVKPVCATKGYEVFNMMP
jgi:hypothetical protein